jgi:DNA-binding NarL/FixJ family response regulator
MKAHPIRILCVDDHAFLVEGLWARLELEPDMECVGRLETADRLLQEVDRTQADVVMLDIEMPGPDPFEKLKDLHRRFSDVRTIVLSAYVRDHYFEAAVEAGAWGYLSKSDSPDEIVEGIRKVMRGDFALGSHVRDRCQLVKGIGTVRAKEVKPASRLSGLTAREQQILRMIGRGLSRSEIAKAIYRSPKTVDAHRASIMEKLGIHDRVELVRYAIREGLAEA